MFTGRRYENVSKETDMKLRNYVLPVFMAAVAGLGTGGLLYHAAATPDMFQQKYKSLSPSDAKALSVNFAEDIALIVWTMGMTLGIEKAKAWEQLQAQLSEPPVVPIRPFNPR